MRNCGVDQLEELILNLLFVVVDRVWNFNDLNYFQIVVMSVQKSYFELKVLNLALVRCLNLKNELVSTLVDT